MMQLQKSRAALMCGIFGCAAPFSLLMGEAAGTNPDVIRLNGIVRDFRASHTDFGKEPAGTGDVAGNVEVVLGDDGLPEMALPVTNFTITDGVISTTQPFSARVAVLGAAITSGGSNVPVTMRVTIGAESHDPFGSYNSPNAGDVNDDDNPRHHIFPTNDVYPAHTPVTVRGSSWLQASNNDDDDGGGGSWNRHIEADSADDDPNVIVLKNGDLVPSIAGSFGQSSIEDYVQGYINGSTREVTIADNQAILLFELGTTNLGSSAADFQDLVCLVTLATDPAYFLNAGSEETATASAGYEVASPWRDKDNYAIAPHMYQDSGTDDCGKGIADSPGTKGASNSGGVTTAPSFLQWFDDVPGVNLSMTHAIELVNDGSGVYEYEDEYFYPADDELFGNESLAHNYNFTYAIEAEFTHDACAGKFLEFFGSDGAWVYINGQLAIDLGGVNTLQTQRVSFDRFGLTDGDTYTMHLFFAQRKPTTSSFRLRTNVQFSTDGVIPAVTAAFD